MNVTATSRDAIMKVCRKIVKEEGISAVNMRAVAAKCQVAVGSVYNYFPSKADLLCAVIESIWKDIFHMPKEDFDFTDFTDCLVWLLASIEEGGQKYPEFFSMHALSLTSGNKAAGRQMMEQCMLHVKQSLLTVLEKDPNVNRGVFNEVLTPNIFIDYLFTIIIASLMDSGQKCDGLLQIVKRVLYEIPTDAGGNYF